MSRLITLILLTTFFYTTGFAQPISRATSKVNLETAQKQADLQDYIRALEYYDKYFEETGDTDVYPEMARLSIKLRDYKKAERYYSRYLGDGEEDEELTRKQKEKDADADLNSFQYALKKGKEAVSKGKSSVKKKVGSKKKKKQSDCKKRQKKER